jgi:hypothetical protein
MSGLSGSRAASLPPQLENVGVVQSGVRISVLQFTATPPPVLATAGVVSYADEI